MRKQDLGKVAKVWNKRKEDEIQRKEETKIMSGSKKHTKG